MNVTSSMTLGVDVGGTFTDFIVVAEDGAVHCWKIPSTPSRPADSTINGFAVIAEDLGLTADQLERMQHTHSSTIATNAVIERRGPNLGVLVTRGFRDLFELQRLAVPDPLRYDSTRPRPIVPRARVAEVDERLTVDGTVLEALDRDQLIAATQQLVDAGAESLVIAFVHSYVNAKHEQEARDILNTAFPDVAVEISAEVWPQAREYERATLTAINASIRPVMQGYLDSIAEGMRQHKVAAEATIARSNGGMQRAHTIRSWPVAALLSGPASGVAGAARVAADAGLTDADLVTVDVGGTSADIGIVREGAPLLSSDEHIAQMPLLVPTTAVSAIGAGGGSIIWVDDLGMLKVGPESLGADPAPACYGKQDHTPGLSDAFLVAGWLSPEQELGGRIALDLDASRRALSTVAQKLGTSVEEVADGAVRIAVAMMAAEASKVLARRGVDAPNFTLVSYGGAGPLIGALLAEDTYIDSVLVPPQPGALSAFGAARSNMEGDLVAPVYRKSSELKPGDLTVSWEDLAKRVQTWIATEQDTLPVTETYVRWSLEMRYEGQGYDVNVAIPETLLAEDDLGGITDEFHAAHKHLFGHSSPDADIWLKELRAHVVGVVDKPETVHMAPENIEATSHTTSRTVRINGEVHEARVLERSALEVGQQFVGPVIVEQMDTTVLVPANWEAEVAASGAILLTKKETSR